MLCTVHNGGVHQSELTPLYLSDISQKDLNLFSCIGMGFLLEIHHTQYPVDVGGTSRTHMHVNRDTLCRLIMNRVTNDGRTDTQFASCGIVRDKVYRMCSTYPLGCYFLSRGSHIMTRGPHVNVPDLKSYF
jgi:hypothetical protein